jgi:hypothetical protein
MVWSITGPLFVFFQVSEYSYQNLETETSATALGGIAYFYLEPCHPNASGETTDQNRKYDEKYTRGQHGRL